MKILFRTLGAEILKLRRTLALRLAFVAPLVLVGANVGMFLERGSISTPEGVAAWIWYGQMNVVVWGLLMIPLFVTLETALVGNVEHANDHWKHLHALPVARGVIYVGKQFSGMVLVGVSSLALVLHTVGGGMLLKLLRPEIGLGPTVPWGRFFAYAGMTYLASWLIISIQTWISLRWKSFVVACATGIALTVAGVFVIHADWGSFWPWALPGAVANEFSDGFLLVRELLFGTLGSIVVALIGGWDVSRRDVV